MKSKIFLFLVLSIISSSENIVKQTNDKDFFASLISAFDNETLLKNWINFGVKKNEIAVSLLKEIIVKLKDILTVIDKPENEELKKLIVDTKTSFPDEIAHPYFETYIISESICRILKLYDLFEELGDDSCDIDEICQFKSDTNLIKSFEISKTSELYYKIVLSEYESIYSVIVKDIFLVVSYHLQEDYLYLRKLLSNKQTELLFNKTVWVFVRHFFKYSRDMLDEILVVDKTGHTYILASKDGMTFSQKCFLNMSNNYLKNEFKILFPVQQMQDFENIYSSYDETRYLTMKKYIDRRYVCNKVLTELLISLIHFYTMRTGENTKYVINLNKEGFYETKWSSSKAFG